AAMSSLQLVTAEEFYSPRHSSIFEAIQALYDRHSTVDEIMLQEELERTGKLEAAGGLEYIDELIQRLPVATNADHYGRIVHEKAILRSLVGVCSEIAEQVYTSDTSASEQQDVAEQKIMEIGKRDAGRDFVPIGEILQEHFQKIEDPDTDVSTVFTGYNELDQMTTGLHASELIIVAGRPSMGKTSFSMCIVQNAAIAGKNVAVFSLEVARDQLTQNLLCSFSQVSGHRIRNSKSLSRREWDLLIDGASRLGKANIFIDDSPGLNPMTLKAKARRLHARHPLDLVVIDYLQLMESGGGESRQQEVSAISRSLKGLARELQVPVITLSQLSRSVESREDRRPRMSDLRESGAIEQDADLILLLYRDEYYNPEKEESKGLAEVIIAKQRNGPTGTVKLVFRGDYMRFENADLVHEEPY
ncbi:MAG: replicative DNA helicase, partial [Planctomycetota bacterium]